MIDIKVEKTGSSDRPLPRYQSAGAAGMDLHAALSLPLIIGPGERRLIPTGLKFAIPTGYEGQIRARSSLALRNGVTVLNGPGTIDSDYRGEVGVVLINHGSDPFVVQPEARIAQIVFQRVVLATLVPVTTLDETDRGGGGYGSTGR